MTKLFDVLTSGKMLILTATYISPEFTSYLVIIPKQKLFKTAVAVVKHFFANALI